MVRAKRIRDEHGAVGRRGMLQQGRPPPHHGVLCAAGGMRASAPRDHFVAEPVARRRLAWPVSYTHLRAHETSAHP
eukprot:10262279-Alexandrium_andersonii.AAC.1